ncbi:MAG: hypothetical protein NTW55_02850 [Planctomycetota bacterium]|nr:hypothetical protein [Planctomycetota bacterium]
MERKENNFEKNIERLVKMAGGANEPSKEFADSLIKKALGELNKTQQPGIIPFRRPAWIGAAAVLAAVLILFVALFFRNQTQEKQISKGEIESKRQAESPYLVSSDKKDNFDKPAAVAMNEKAGSEQDLGKVSEGVMAEESVPEQPPFAPASAIELVTLPRRENVQITIYNSADLTFVRERRNLTLKRGWNWLQFMWANTLIDPTSLYLEPMQEKDKVDIQQLVFPARLKDVGRWLIRSQISGQVPFEITYFTSGIAWRAFYMGTLSADEQKMKLQGYVRVDNKSGEDYENAQTRLIVGQVHTLDQIAALAKREYPYNRPGQKMILDERFKGREVQALGAGVAYDYKLNSLLEFNVKEIKKEGLSEYFLYTIEGTETIPDKWGKRLLSFDINDINVGSLYKYDEQRWGGDTVRFVTFVNDKEHNLGQTPIPNGDMRIYSQADSEGYLSYVGGTSVKYIPVDEKVELNLGPARLVSVKPTLMDFKKDNFMFDSKGNVSGWDEIRKWKVEAANTRNLAAEVEITRGFGTAYWTLQINDKDVSYEKYDAAHARFRMKLEPESKRTFEYIVTTYHSVREESFAKLK